MGAIFSCFKDEETEARKLRKLLSYDSKSVE